MLTWCSSYPINDEANPTKIIDVSVSAKIKMKKRTTKSRVKVEFTGRWLTVIEQIEVNLDLPIKSYTYSNVKLVIGGQIGHSLSQLFFLNIFFVRNISKRSFRNGYPLDFGEKRPQHSIQETKKFHIKFIELHRSQKNYEELRLCCLIKRETNPKHSVAAFAVVVRISSNRSAMDRGGQVSPVPATATAPRKVRREHMRLGVYHDVLQRLRDAGAPEALAPDFAEKLWTHFHRFNARFLIQPPCASLLPKTRVCMFDFVSKIDL